MKSHGRYSIATQLFCFQNREIPRPSPKLFEQILTKKGLGLRSRCVHGLNKLNPFATLQDWVPFSFIPAALHHFCIMCWVLQVGILNYVAQTMYVPSYMSWNDEFQAGACFIFWRSGQSLTHLFFLCQCEKMGKEEGHQESMSVDTRKVLRSFRRRASPRSLNAELGGRRWTFSRTSSWTRSRSSSGPR